MVVGTVDAELSQDVEVVLLLAVLGVVVEETTGDEFVLISLSVDVLLLVVLGVAGDEVLQASFSVDVL